MIVVGSAGNNNVTCTIPAHQAGDLILISVRRPANVIATKPAAGGTVPAWQDIVAVAGANTLALATYGFVATGSGHTSGSWTNAAHIIVLVLRPAAGKVLQIGPSSTGNANNTTTMVFPALTTDLKNGTSWIVRFGTKGAASFAHDTPPTNYTRQLIYPAGSGALMGVYTRSGITANATADSTTGFASSAYRAHSIEIKETDPPAKATGATAGSPGSFTPGGSLTPNNLAHLSAAPAVVASPTSAWATGQRVVTADAQEAYWDGTAWQLGRAPAPPPSENEAKALKDNFTADAIDAGKWPTIVGTVSTDTDRLKVDITKPKSYIETTKTYDLTNSEFLIRFNSIPATWGNGSKRMGIEARIDDNNKIVIACQAAGDMRYEYWVGGVKTDTGLGYLAEYDQWFRIRHDPANHYIYLETGYNDVTQSGQWAAWQSIPEANAPPYTALKFRVWAEYTGTETPSFALFDELNLYPGDVMPPSGTAHTITPSDTVTLSDLADLVVTPGAAPLDITEADSVTTSDVAIFVQDFAISLADTATVTDTAPTWVQDHSFAPADSVTLSDNASLIVTAPAGPKIETLTDTFDTLDMGKWIGTYGGVTVVGGQAKIPCTSSYPSLVTDYNNPYWDFRDSAIYAKVTVPPLGTGTRETSFDVVRDPGSQDKFTIYCTGQTIYTRVRRGGANVSSGSVAYSPTNHAWWRIRESAGIVYFEASPDGTTWSPLGSAPSYTHLIDVTSVWTGFSAGYYGTEVASDAYVDNVNTVPASQALTLDVTDSVALSDAPGFVQDSVISFADTATTSDVLALAQDAVIALADTVTTTDAPPTWVQDFILDLADAVATSELLSLDLLGALSLDVADSVTVSDSLVDTTWDYASVFADTVTVSDAPSLALDAVISFADSVTTSDLFDQVAALALDAADTATTSDVASLALDIIFNLADAVNVSDLASLDYSFDLAVADTVTTSDALTTLALDYVIGIADSVALSDSLNIDMTGALSLDVSDSVTVTDVAYLALPSDRPQFSKAFSGAYEQLGARGGATSVESGGAGRATVISKTGGAFEVVGGGASPAFLTDWTIPAADTVTTSDALSLAQAHDLSVADSVTTSDISDFTGAFTLTVADSVTVTDAPDLVGDYVLSFADTVTVSDTPDLFIVIPKTGGAVEGASAGAARATRVSESGGGIEIATGGAVWASKASKTLGAVESQVGGGYRYQEVVAAKQGGAISAESGTGTPEVLRLVTKAGGAAEGSVGGIAPTTRLISKSGGGISAEYGAVIVGLAEVGGGSSPEVGGISKSILVVKQGGAVEVGVAGGAGAQSIVYAKSGGGIEAQVAGGARATSLVLVKAGGAAEGQQAGGSRAILVINSGGGISEEYVGGSKKAILFKVAGGISSEVGSGFRSMLYVITKVGGGYEISRGGAQRQSIHSLVGGGTVPERGGGLPGKLMVRAGGAISTEFIGLFRQTIISKRVGGISEESPGGYGYRIKTFQEGGAWSSEAGGGKLDYTLTISSGEGEEGELIGTDYPATLISASSESSTGQLIGATTGAMVLSGIEKPKLVAAQEEVTFE